MVPETSVVRGPVTLFNNSALLDFFFPQQLFQVFLRYSSFTEIFILESSVFSIYACFDFLSNVGFIVLIVSNLFLFHHVINAKFYVVRYSARGFFQL